jgi:uncharacterized delta-60 repeat protein
MKYNYLKYSLLTLAIYCMPVLLQAQITFEEVYGNLYDRDGFDVVPTDDGGYLIVGFTTNDVFNDTDVLILKVNSTGALLSTKTYGGALPDNAYSILKAADGNYFVLGYSQSYGGGDYDTYLLKINSSGDTLWTRTYGSYGNEQGKEIVPTSDGNYMMVGYTNGLASSNYNAYLTKIDINGNEIWSKQYGGGAYEAGASVKQCADGGFIMLGQTFSYGQGDSDAYVVKTNSSGDTVWTKTFGGAHYDEGAFTIENTDGSFMFVVRDSSAGFGDVDIRIVKTTGTGSVIWDRNYGGDKKDTGKMIQKTSDGNFIVAGHSRSFGWQTPNMWLLKLNQSGDTIWTRNYGGFDHEHCYVARETSDGGFIAVGKTESFSSVNEVMLLKLNSIGTLSTTVNAEEYLVDGMTIYPNPTDGIVNINFDNLYPDKALVSISNALGQVVFKDWINPAASGYSKAIDLHGNQPGMYILTVQAHDKLITKRISLQ